MKTAISLAILGGMFCAGIGLTAASASSAPFKDVNAGHWARTQIEQAAAKGYVSGYPDGTFAAAKTVTRAELIKMIVDALRLPHSQGGSPWYQGYVSAAFEFGILDETDSTDYEKPIRRIEIMRIVSRTLSAESRYREYLDSFQSLKKHNLPFADRETAQNRDVPYIALAYGAGIVNGFPDRTMQLSRTATRAEAVVIVEKWLEQRGSDPLLSERLREMNFIQDETIS
ncbi:S-layer homology domain-containing protein [Paenibacillaceae bacterium WGS1546]|uniref:S-layer homology domain-containing protein n=1 Tax=Cohnella sp. WGS1546 TaxID=3366810 RepID=UPI00372D0019